MPNLAQTPDKLEVMFQGLMSEHAKLISLLNPVPKRPIDPGAFLDEWISGVLSPVSFAFQIDRPALIKYILYAYTPVGAATLTIGPANATVQNSSIRSIPIASASTQNPGSFACAIKVNPGDVITLTAVGATSLFLEAMGVSLSGTDWSLI